METGDLSTGDVPGTSLPLSEAAFLLALGGGEALILAGLARAEAPVLAIVLLHLLTIAALAAAVLVVRGSRDTSLLMLALIVGTATGPMGIVGAALLGLVTGRGGGRRQLLAAWYERIALSTAVDPETRLCDDVGVGRTLGLSSHPPVAFPTVMAGGALQMRQAILGHIARHFDPAYLPTLKIALESEEPVLRVQAAAVAAHVAPQVAALLRSRLADLPTADAGDEAVLAVVRELELLVGSGLVDESERLSAADAACRLGDEIVARVAARRRPAAPVSEVARAAAMRATLERLLVERRRFAELRRLRAADRIAARHPSARLVRLHPRRQPAGVAA